MKKVLLHQTDAFTTKLFGGNPAGVVTDANGLTDETMKNIAREMNLSETAFVLKPTKKAADVKLRYFTSGKAEVKFCGHATIAALYEIARNGLFGTEKSGIYSFFIETNAGVLEMDIIKKSHEDISVQFTAPQVSLETYKSQYKTCAKRFGISERVMDTRYPVMIDTNLHYLYIVIKSLQDLGSLAFDFQLIKENFKDEGVVVFCLLTPETFEKGNTVHARGLAPLVGVPEDPFTGSMQAGLATYATKNGIVAENTAKILTEQGHFIGRPGYATIEKKEDRYTVTGNAVHVFSTELTL